MSKSVILNIIRFTLLSIVNILVGVYASVQIMAITMMISILLIILTFIYYKNYKKEAENQVNEIKYHVENQGNNIFKSMPIGIMVLNGSGFIRWHNAFLEEIVGENIELHHIDEYFENISNKIENSSCFNIDYKDKSYNVLTKDSAVYLFENTSSAHLEKRYEKEKAVIGYIHLDNYEDYYNSLDEQRANDIILGISKLISTWCTTHQIFYKRYGGGKYIMFLEKASLEAMKETKFDILDSVRQFGVMEKLPLTLSMSFATNIENQVTLGEVALDGLDLVLSRGGDQVVVKDGDNKNVFYGGKTDAFEKRNRVKARMYSQSIGNLVRNSDSVVIMTHINPDFDAIGSCVAMSKFVDSYEKEFKVVFNKNHLSNSSKKLLDELHDTVFYKNLCDGEDALQFMNKDTLLIVVDTNRVSLVESKEVIDYAVNTIVIDHHRRSDDFISNPLVAYIEPYASSTNELITELITFQDSKVMISPIEATAMIGGIIVDTKHFVYRTGNRTFDAAAKLKAWGADSILVQDLLKEDLERVVVRNQLISRLEIVGDGLAITSLNEGTITNDLLAQTADEILEIEGINGSFVIGKLRNGLVGVSARSLGTINVQIIMEAFNGGGHMSAAATQLDTDVASAYEEIKNYLGGEKI